MCLRAGSFSFQVCSIVRNVPKESTAISSMCSGIPHESSSRLTRTSICLQIGMAVSPAGSQSGHGHKEGTAQTGAHGGAPYGAAGAGRDEAGVEKDGAAAERGEVGAGVGKDVVEAGRGGAGNGEVGAEVRRANGRVMAGTAKPHSRANGPGEAGVGVGKDAGPGVEIGMGTSSQESGPPEHRDLRTSLRAKNF